MKENKLNYCNCGYLRAVGPFILEWKIVYCQNYHKGEK